ncbi:hypothetical protein CSUB01_05041 [Colletotrichum sublineola]|uniref:Uncharacterized protein n=1 Tax=Colletotrichum sublineola TaxID=1173701 RepID=A0A066X8A2_COLSU|nr:hypothetical protein CSUB01_05041 [Colletotrichum sublineola]
MVIPTIYLRMKVRIIRDFVPGIPEHDRVAAIGVATFRRTRFFRKGDVAMWDDFTMRPPIVIEVRCPIQTLQGSGPWEEGIFPIHHSFVQFGIPPEPEPKPKSRQ